MLNFTIFAYYNSIFAYYMKSIMNEKLLISSQSPLMARYYDYAHFTYPWHFHSEYEIIYIEKGTGTRFVGNSIEKFGDGEVLFIGSNLPHYLKSDDSYHAEKSGLRAKGTIVQFEKDFMHYSLNYYPQFIGIKRLFKEANAGVIFPVGCSEKLIWLLNRIPLDKGFDQIITLLQILGEMSNIKTRRMISTQMDNFPAQKGIKRLDKIISFINKNYTRKITLEEIASYSAMNPSAFCRYFKKETGKSFVNFVTEMRIGYACKLLLMNKLNVSQVGAECGFENISHFNKSFKKVKGYSPSDYRKEMLLV